MISIVYSFLSFSKIKPRITPEESKINTNDLKASVLRRPFLSVIRAFFNHSGYSLSFCPRKDPAIPGSMITSKINPPVIPVAIFNPLIISFFVMVPLKISLSARNPRSGIQNSAITRVIVTALNLL